MRQEPTSQQPAWVIIGYGRLGRTLSNILLLKNIPHSVLRSTDQNRIPLICQNAERVLLCVPDSKILELVEFKKESASWIHFSATVSDPRITRAHPMRSFDGRILSSTEFSEIPFALDLGSPPIHQLLPTFTNPCFYLSPDEFQKYHALCVLSAAVPVLLWSLVEKQLDALGINFEYLRNYAQTVGSNFFEKGSDAMTGPWIRDDQITTQKNIEALSQLSPELKNIYQVALQSFQSRSSGLRQESENPDAEL